ncbi:MAG: RNA polymerase factor sigma-32 [Deltaproteobacteria bacterium]|nr:RNA polymerase factor sigma-32 [Deltaproteobacteria bacterium]
MGRPRKARGAASEKSSGKRAAAPEEAQVVEQTAEEESEEESEEVSDAEVEESFSKQGKDDEVSDAEVVEAPQPRALAKAERGLGPVDALQRYMRDVERHPLLTREEEHELAVRLREKGDLDAAYRLVTANLRLVVKIAHEYHRTAFSLLDLVQEGNVGLMHAVKKFDPYRGVKLSSYAAWWIRAYILRYVMENWRMVKLGTTQAQRKLFFNLRKEQARMAAEGFDPTPKLLAERLNVTEQDVTEMDQRLSQDEFSFDAPLQSDESQRTTRGERFVSSAEPADERLAEHQLKEILRAKLVEFGKTLKDKEKYIFEKRLIAEEPMTLQEIGDQYGLTRERARQIEAKLVRGLKEWIQREVPDFKDLEIGSRGE